MEYRSAFAPWGAVWVSLVSSEFILNIRKFPVRLNSLLRSSGAIAMESGQSWWIRDIETFFHSKGRLWKNVLITSDFPHTKRPVLHKFEIFVWYIWIFLSFVSTNCSPHNRVIRDLRRDATHVTSFHLYHKAITRVLEIDPRGTTSISRDLVQDTGYAITTVVHRMWVLL